MNVQKTLPLVLVLIAVGIVAMGLRKEAQAPQKPEAPKPPKITVHEVPEARGRIVWHCSGGATFTARLDREPDGTFQAQRVWEYRGAVMTIDADCKSVLFKYPVLFRYQSAEGKVFERILGPGDRGILVDDGKERIERVYP